MAVINAYDMQQKESAIPAVKLIDVEKVIQEKNPKLLQLLPGFALRYIKRILHQDQVNDFINRNGNKTGFEFIERIVTEFGADVSYQGLENLPLSGGCIVAANHPLGGLDGITLLHVIGQKRRDVKFIVNDILMVFKNLNDVFIPVNKHGKNPSESIRLINEQFASESVSMVFPAGLVSRKQGSKIADLEWKKSFITKARQYKRDIIPVHIGGQNSSFFYNLALWRKRVGINANLEMFFLMDEMYKQDKKKIHISFGKAIPWETFNRTRKDEEWANHVKNVVYSL